jgi:signal peptidase I
VAPEDGELQSYKRPVKFLLFNLKQDYQFNGKTYTIWFPEDELFKRAGYRVAEMNGDGEIIGSAQIKAGDPILRLKVLAGDHLFVDRVSYNFRHPSRGEIIVFETKNIMLMDEKQRGEFYIKRLVALGDEKVQIGNDRHLIIDGKRLDKDTPHFENVYSFDPAQPPAESQYSGHVNQAVAREYGFNYNIAPLFPDESKVVQLQPHHYMVMGDNTMNSSDSRYWGDFSRTNVIGKYLFVYWPYSKRFGFNVR